MDGHYERTKSSTIRVGIADADGEEEEAPRAAHSKFGYQALSVNSLVFYLTVNRLRYRRQPHAPVKRASKQEGRKEDED